MPEEWAMRCEIEPGVIVSYQEKGSGRPLVWLHAFPLSQEMWEPQREALCIHAHVLTPDLPGFGDSTPLPDPPTVEGMADRVVAWLDALAIAEPIVLGGLSMGGYVAMAFARRYPDRLRGLILADTKSEPDDDAGKAGREQMIAFAREHPPYAVIEKMLPRLLGPTTLTDRHAVLDRVRSIASRQSSAGIIAALQALRDRPDAGPGLESLPTPTLILVGEEDVLTPPELAARLASRMSEVRLINLPRAGHLANLEMPHAFNDAVTTFLAGLPR
jgi:pimeloyl-ACP methyl ester carboxylesterase